jgi:SAM-dependent methyltransferase
MKTVNVSTLVSAAVHFPNLRILLRQAIRGCATFLDVGCGTGSPIARLTARGYLVTDHHPHPERI